MDKQRFMFYGVHKEFTDAVVMLFYFTFFYTTYLTRNSNFKICEDPTMNMLSHYKFALQPCCCYCWQDLERFQDA